MKEFTAKNKKPDIGKLCAFGFCKNGENYIYRKELCGTSLVLEAAVLPDGKLTTRVYDRDFGDEYVLHQNESVTGAFVGKVREMHDGTVEEIFAECFDDSVYKTNCARDALYYIKERFGDKAVFPFDDENCVVKHAENGKWYAVFLKIPPSKIGAECGNGEKIIEILNVKAAPETVSALCDGERYFPAYHMNKKHWLTVPLDGRVDISEICRRIDESFYLTAQRGK